MTAVTDGRTCEVICLLGLLSLIRARVRAVLASGDVDRTPHRQSAAAAAAEATFLLTEGEEREGRGRRGIRIRAVVRRERRRRCCERSR